MHVHNTMIRNEGLLQMLVARRGELQSDVASRMRDSRSDKAGAGRDMVDTSDANVQEDLECTLLQMRGETLIRIDEAIARLSKGAYGACARCGDEIASARLSALPFAVRCQACQARRERKHAARPGAHGRRSLSLLSDLAAP